jgi:hypothetical protein
MSSPAKVRTALTTVTAVSSVSVYVRSACETYTNLVPTSVAVICTGPKLCTGSQLAEAASKVLGTSMEFEDISVAEAKKVLKAQSDSDPSELLYLLEYYSLVREGKTVRNVPVRTACETDTDFVHQHLELHLHFCVRERHRQPSAGARRLLQGL